MFVSSVSSVRVGSKRDTAQVVTVRCELQQAPAAHLTVWLTPLTLNTMLCSAHIVLGPSLSTKLGLFLFVRSIRSRSASYLAIKKSLRRVSQTKDKFGPRHIYIGLSYLFGKRHLSLLFAIGCFQCALAYFHVLNNLRKAQHSGIEWVDIVLSRIPN